MDLEIIWINFLIDGGIKSYLPKTNQITYFFS